MSGDCTIVMYHYVRDLQRGRYPDINGLDEDEFRYQVDYLSRNYTFVAAEDLIEHHRGNRELPSDAALLTFDDGFSDHYDTVYPVLKRCGVQGCFFPPTMPIVDDMVLDVHKIHFILASVEDTEHVTAALFDLIRQYRTQYELDSLEHYYEEFAGESRYDPEEVVFIKRALQHGLPEAVRSNIVDELFKRYVDVDEAVLSHELYMSPDQLRVMHDGGMHIGSHGHEHYWLNQLSAKEATQDIKESLDTLESIGVTQQDWLMCYPYGAYNEQTLDIVRDLGCAAAVTTEPRVANIDVDPIFELPRLDTNDLPQSST